MQLTKEDLQEIAGVATLLLELKEAEEFRAIIDAIPQLAAELMIESVNAFSTQMDIDAVKQMHNAGFTMEQAIALRCGRKGSAILSTISNAIQNRKGKE
jgi:hypothetical protein